MCIRDSYYPLQEALPFFFSILGALGFTSAIFGPGSFSMPIHLDDISCSGTESNLLNCTSNPVGVHNCNHHEDAGVDCLGRSPGTHTTSTCMGERVATIESIEGCCYCYILLA